MKNFNIIYVECNPKGCQKRINIDMKLLLKWLKANKISLNVDKTEIIIFKHKLKKIKFDFKVKRLVFQDCVNYLGAFGLSTNGRNKWKRWPSEWFIEFWELLA